MHFSAILEYRMIYGILEMKERMITFKKNYDYGRREET